MMRVEKIYMLVLVTLLLGVSPSYAAAADTQPNSTHVEAVDAEDEDESATERVSPFRRVDREINKRKFIFRGETILGATASYYTLSSDNADYLLLMTGVNASGTVASVEPFAGYFYRDNRAVGVRFGYSTTNGEIESATLDFGDSNNISFDVPYIGYNSKNYTYGLFHRAYAALDPHGHFGLFAEIQLTGLFGNSTFEYESGGVLKSINSDTRKIALSFNPGISVFVLPNLSASMSFEFGGLSYTNIKQYDAEGNYCGMREASKMKFMFNVLAINFGITMHLW